MSAASNTFQQAFNQMSEVGRTGQSGQQFTSNLQSLKSFTDQAGANIANSVGAKHGINSQQLAGVVSNLLLNGSLGLGGEENLEKEEEEVSLRK